MTQPLRIELAIETVGADLVHFDVMDTCVAGSAAFGAPDAHGGYRGVMNTLRQAARQANPQH